MMKIYVIRREDCLVALTSGQIPEGCLLCVGSLWCEVAFTSEQRANYTFPICEA